jgi:predicted DNA-binding ribbon-helix-helix protein
MRRYKRQTKENKVNKSVYMEEKLFKSLDKLAKKENVTFNSLLVEILDKYMEELEK